ncbi:MAG: epoxyqueuosine reductase QueH [Candidatus Margulisbacteria bacterium]|jgi:predicted adenine nucleotide alpha hydrolase (AANH) superfamily ATPase|nr:epoxyqueuosine reductase QueH [Candidatus Margulisiibacteriota bacterium]
MKKTKLLLHACCAPCASAVLENLAGEYALTLLYFNPNIQPAGEYQKRLGEFQKLKNKFTFELLAPDYAPQPWLNELKDWAAEPEGGARCARCFVFRLDYAAALARDYAGFATTLSISPHKNPAQIEQAGQTAARNYGAVFLDFNFQKLYPRSLELSRELGLYRQKYCGCLYARNN